LKEMKMKMEDVLLAASAVFLAVLCVALGYGMGQSSELQKQKLLEYDKCMVATLSQSPQSPSEAAVFCRSLSRVVMNSPGEDDE
jgi:hypothetical protein